MLHQYSPSNEQFRHYQNFFPALGHAERLAVTFVDCGEAAAKRTRVIIAHERIPDGATRASHEAGWVGCLEGLQHYADAHE